MELNVAVRLIRKGIEPDTSQVWADLGCGNGLFTKALASLLPAGSEVYAVDKDPGALGSLEDKVHDVTIHKRINDFTQDDLPLRSLDGVLMANAFHFVEEKKIFVNTLRALLKPTGRIILIEYDTDHPNAWVPFPISFNTLNHFVKGAGIPGIIKLDEEPSIYGHATMYSSLLKI